MYHFFLVDLCNDGNMYRVGVISSAPNAVQEIKAYLQKYSKDVLYEESRTSVNKKFLKHQRKTEVGNIFASYFLFDKCMKVPYQHWSSRLRRKLVARQNNEVYLVNE